MSDTATMHIDGASRGNPARRLMPSYCAAGASGRRRSRHDRHHVEQRRRIHRTGRRALALAAELGVKKLHIHSDSELMVKQMNGEYKVKSEGLARPVRRGVPVAEAIREGDDRRTFAASRTNEPTRLATASTSTASPCNAASPSSNPKRFRPRLLHQHREPRKRRVDDAGSAPMRFSASRTRHTTGQQVA